MKGERKLNLKKVQNIIKLKCEGLCQGVHLSTARRNHITVRKGGACARVLEETTGAAVEHDPQSC